MFRKNELVITAYLTVFEKAMEPTKTMDPHSSRNFINSKELKSYWLWNKILRIGEWQSTSDTIPTGIVTMLNKLHVVMLNLAGVTMNEQSVVKDPSRSKIAATFCM